jgi:hypothetical protein
MRTGAGRLLPIQRFVPVGEQSQFLLVLRPERPKLCAWRQEPHPLSFPQTVGSRRPLEGKSGMQGADPIAFGSVPLRFRA